MSHLHVILDNPVIPPNTGNAIRMCAGTGATLHLVEPLGFDLSEKHLRRAGLDYHDLADVQIHPSLDACLSTLPASRVFAFTTDATTHFHTVAYRDSDALLFGTEPTGLPPEHSHHPRVTRRLRIPMLPGRRSMNLSNSAAVATYEAWRQLGYAGGV
ncbi:tRNA (cytidine(34)-2'-O)-methyltransferase [Corynebacterium sanguinis]|uniref:Putative tRNA (cytidine(34)-2'-O)-methyltransferase n=1 Tax=Corynebacterium sanguinis TaxID=2594913 RepID=A0A6C1U016_9CORY|nr:MULTISPECIES: tRNA (cytidine(34)-2'-O)-methyltransferase [Corynebacterium]MBA4504520.1 tRNA (cytidine(34)-2'-O)-methyltransferase [Corynebacterium sanguinis]MCT1412565.1 tRNA (cytidine(34)-2'-O)-methyltransferase [Corynebacterium sanguinis]MCT1413804.1 tRNA (cytidine(34)-2'-O)-methyltransferase [Corynebacterium sanguinis]MCT1425486.1 tRNA (cytidine(34)-2'-O)-methyltransferase [Corynebacterium sanguinis]MCT1444816.1 tRNA (cytidine(34)-2'-O)-methyltransferase [Corynebacterium sanguinis]